MPSSGLHERKPSELAHPAAPLDFDEESSSSSNTTGTDTFAAQAIRRVQNLVQVQQKWWKNERRSLTRTTAPGTPGGRSSRRDVAPLAKRLGDFLSIFYVTEDPRGGCTPSSGGTIPLPSTSGFPTPSPLLASTTRISPYPRTTKRPPALSRKGWLAVALLFLLGLRELVVLSRPGGGRREVKIRGRDPLATVAELKATERNGKGRGKGRPLPGTERLWKLKPASATPSPIAGEGLERWADEEVEGDTTAIVLHWKRTDNVKVIVADLCQYSFFQTVFIWNNNPDIHLTRQVRPLLFPLTFEGPSLTVDPTFGACDTALRLYPLPSRPPSHLQFTPQHALHLTLSRLRAIDHTLLLLPRRRLARPTTAIHLRSV